ncbi:beta-galactosidase [Puniceicoccus vermicola]|uniref:Beta-galactosidase n=1 Tax=Puniceicoccus vermicola TaxID=388746 RepID=A0A7X1AZ82_9BACT|nr:beta-galactosidase [Puniceicoccus vermicola]MBC2602693.1 beta-galactosidase [Puniceicoccus vermicola]
MFLRILLLLSVFSFPGLPSPLMASTNEDPVERIPEMADVESWVIAENGSDRLSWFPISERLGLGITDFRRGDIADIWLKEPVRVPEWSDEFSLDIHSTGGWPTGFQLRLLVKDCQGHVYDYDLHSNLLPKRTHYFANNQRPRAVRVYAPGFKRPVMRRAGATLDAVDPSVRDLPEPPLSVVGIRFEGLNYKEPAAGENAKPLVFSLGNFKFTRLLWREADFYYSLADTEYFGADDPVPSLSLGELKQPHYGEQFVISWDVRDEYAGQPFLVGGEEILVDRDDPDYRNTFLRKIEIPVFAEGSYWIRVKKKWNREPARLTSRIDEFEFRLDILAGEEPADREEVAPEVQVPYSFLRMAPNRESFVGEENDSVLWETAFWLPDDADRHEYQWKLTIRHDSSGELVDEFEGDLESVPQRQMVPVSLGKMKAGTYQMKMDVFEDGELMDRETRLFGVKEAESPWSEIPASIPSYEEILEGDSIIYLMPHGYGSIRDPEERWRLLKNFLDRASEITSTVEFIVRWRDIEPMEGVYDWSELDRFLDYAETKGVTVLIWPSIMGAEPEWLPAIYEKPRNEDGEIYNPIPYTFHGGRINHYYSDEVKAATLNLYRTLAERYRGSPAVHGYFVLTEHPYDMPTSGWYIGGSEETLGQFRDHLRREFQTLEAVNSRWATDYASWEAIIVPPEEATGRQRLDWLAFLRRGVGSHLIDCVETIREVDDHRIIQVYTGGQTPETMDALSDMGCMLADGGSQNPETFGGAAMQMADYGLQRRAEEVSVGNWSEHFPTQLDATLYTMLLGGGGNANIKMFYPVRLDYEQLLSAPHSLDRFLQFIPIWKELRYTKTMPREVYVLNDLNAGMLEIERLNYHGELWPDMVLMEAGINAPWGDIDRACRGKMMILPGITVYEEKTIDKIVQYVEDGGTVFLYADSGRSSPDLPEEDWILLRRFGLSVPVTETGVGGYVDVIPVAGDVFDEEAGTWRFRTAWPHDSKEGEEVFAFFDEKVDASAITRFPFGEGQVIVAWASSIVPAVIEEEYPFMRDIARWVGVDLLARSDSPSLWTNLLSQENSDDYYGLVYHPAYLMRGKKAVDGTVFWRLPQGEYQVAEMISEQILGVFSADTLWNEGLSTALGPREVAIYRMKKTESLK